LHRYIDFDALPGTDKRLLIATTELETGQLRIFDNQEIKLTPDHILASCSIPLVYPWTKIEDRHYWDGAVMANTPLAGAIDAGADEIVIVLLSPIGERHMQPPRWPWHALTVVLDLALSATYENDLKQLENVNQLVAAQVDSKHRQIACQVITPSEETDLSRIIRYEPEFSAELIQMGYEDAREELDVA
jgi:NTE family protein